jgi:hypothetical protein
MSVRKQIYILLAVAVSLLWGAFVWPTLYRYDHYTAEGTTVPLRINRLTGRVEAWRAPWRAWH